MKLRLFSAEPLSVRAHLRGQPGWRTAFSRLAMERAWKKVRANAGAPGGDGLSVQAFERRRRERLAELRASIAEGSYRPGPLRRVKIAKAAGGLRELAIPCVGDRVAQTAWVQALCPALDKAMDPASFGYRPARSVSQALALARRHMRSGAKWALDADIQSFFDEAPHTLLLRELENWVADPRLRELAAMWLRSASPNGRGLPQGSPISPILANMFLHPLDTAIASAGLRHVRYADDFIVLCETRMEAEQAHRAIGAFLLRRGLAFNARKTSVRRIDRDLIFLGERLLQRPSVIARLWRWLRRGRSDDRISKGAIAHG